jgi:hypothetical protein
VVEVVNEVVVEVVNIDEVVLEIEESIEVVNEEVVVVPTVVEVDEVSVITNTGTRIAN